MAATNSTSVELPATLLAKAKSYAKEENRSVEVLLQEALLQYMEVPPYVHARARRFKEDAAARGLTPEEYSVELVREARVERHTEKLAS